MLDKILRALLRLSSAARTVKAIKKGRIGPHLQNKVTGKVIRKLTRGLFRRR